MIVHCPNTSAFDFVIFDKCNKIHAIQVTVQTAAKKCNDSDFFKNENIHFKYSLAPYGVYVNAIKLKSKLYDAYVVYGLRIVNGASFLTQKESSAFQLASKPLENLSWRELIKRVFHLQHLYCPCGKRDFPSHEA